MSLDFPKVFSSHGANLLDRVPAGTQNMRLSEMQSEMDSLVGSAVSTVSDEKMMASLFGAGLAGRFVRLGAVAASGKSLAPLAVYGLSHAAALAGESAVFAGIERRFDMWEGHAPTQGFQKEWARAAVNLASLKFLGRAARGQNVIAQHFLIDASMVAGHHAGYALGVMDKPQGSLSQQMIHAEGMNLGMKGSLAMLHGFSPRLSAMERSAEIALMSQESGGIEEGQASLSFSRLAWITKGGPQGFFAGSGKERESKKPELMKISDQNGEGEVEKVVLGHSPKMILIPGGKFRRGSKDFKDTRPVREVEINDFLLGETPVTNAQYLAHVKARQIEPFVLLETADTGRTQVVDVWANPVSMLPRYLRGEVERWDPSTPLIRGGLTLLKVAHPKILRDFGRPNQPVVMVNWYEALAYAALTVRGGRLPTEAEWEYAARGPGGSKYGTQSGKLNREEAHYDAEATADVGSYPPNAYRLYDMTGNVSEWMGDWCQNSYRGLPDQDPTGPSHGIYKVLRGGSWLDDGPDYLRVAFRSGNPPVSRRDIVGFRVAVPVSQDSQ